MFADNPINLWPLPAADSGAVPLSNEQHQEWRHNRGEAVAKGAAGQQPGQLLAQSGQQPKQHQYQQFKRD